MKTRLMLLVVGSIVPLLTLTLLQQYWDFHADIAGAKRETLVLAHSMSRLVAARLDDYVRGMTVLAMTPALRTDPPDLGELRSSVEALGANHPGANIVVVRQDGSELLNLRYPLQTFPDMSAVRQVFATGAPVVSGIRKPGPDEPWGVAISVPVKRAGGPVRYVLSMSPALANFDHILRDDLPPTWIASVYDAQSNLVARSASADRFIGQPIPAALRDQFTNRDSGALEDGPSREGIEVVRVFSRSPPYGWAVGIGIRRSDIIGRALRQAEATIAIGMVLLVISVLTALYTANRIRMPIVSLRQFAVERNGPAAPPVTGLREVDAVADALWSAETERRKSLEDERQALTRLAESEDMGQRILDGALDGFVQFDETLSITEWNRQAEAIFGWSRAEILGAKLHERLLLPQDHERLHQEVAQFLSSGHSRFIGTRQEMDVLRRDGSTVRIEQAVTVVRRSDGHSMFNGFVRDLTAKIIIENQLRQSQKMEAIGNLTGGMAHDFNNLLTVIIGSLDGAHELVPPDSEVRELMQAALDAALRGADLTRGLLAFARQQPLRPREIDLNALLRVSVDLLRRLIGESIEVALNLGTDIWPVRVDPAQLEASLANLATNARDAMPHGGRLTIGTRNQRLDAAYAAVREEILPGDYALIEVSDTGTGIPPDAIERIFDPFFTTKEPGKGTGIGLSMVFGFIKQSAGHISVYSEMGSGTTFRLYLPRVAGTTDTPEVAGVPDIVQTATGETVLVVEDSPAVRQVVLRQVRNLGYSALECDRASAALELLEHQAVDLLFTDVVMPGGIDGFQLARLAQARCPGLKVVLTSGFPQDHVEGSGLSPFRLLSKPYGRTDLAAALRSALNG